MGEVMHGVPSEAVPPRVPRMARNILSNWGVHVFSFVVNFFLAPFVIHKLGDATYGIWVLIVSLTGYLGLLDLGVRGAVTRYVAKFHAASEDKEASHVVSSALGIFAAAGILAIAISLVLAFFVLRFFQIPEAYRQSARIVLLVAGSTVAVSLISGVFGGIVAGMQRLDLVNAVEVAGTGLRSLAIVVALYNGKGIIALACIQLAFSLLRGLANLWLCFFLYPELRIRIRFCDRAHLALIFSYSIYSFLTQISNDIIYYADNVVIGAFLRVDFVTFFAIAGSLVAYARAPLGGISQTMMPLASSLEGQRDHGELQRVTLHSAAFASLLAFPVCCTFLLRGESFIGLWMGSQYAGLSGRVLQILSLALLFSAGNYVASAIMFGIGRQKAVMVISVVEAIGNLGLSIALVRPLGIIGVALGTTLPNLAVNLLFWPFYLQRAVGIRARSYFLAVWLRPAFAMVPFALASYGLERLWPATNLAIFFVQVGAVLPLAVFSAWYACFTPGQRQTYSERIVVPLRRAFGRT